MALGTEIDDRDSDGDGFEDGVEVATGTDPLDSRDPDRTDNDGDGIADVVDNDPSTADSDGDGIHDRYEISEGSDPNDPSDFPPIADADGDGQINIVDAYLLLNVFLGNLSSDLLPGNGLLDVNRDGKQDNVDAVIIFHWHLGNIQRLPFPF